MIKILNKQKLIPLNEIDAKQNNIRALIKAQATKIPIISNNHRQSELPIEAKIAFSS